MKILHTADWHLASPITCRLSAEKAQERRQELLSRFSDMVRYAEENGICAVLLCGDTGDDGVLPFSTQDYLLDVMRTAADIRFFLIPGNHDRESGDAVGGIFTKSRLEAAGGLLDHIRVFGSTWETVRLSEDVTVSGRALTGNAETPSCPCLSEDTYNIVLLHGQLNTGSTLSDAVIGGADDSIPLAAFMNRNVDYLALGHIHSFRHGKIDRRGTWCYPGCPEGRGFDECGDKGFVVLNLDGNVCRGAEFVPFAKRRLQRIAVDVSGVPQGTHALEAAVKKETEDILSADFVRVVLTGEDDAESIRDTAYLQKRLSERFYYAEVTDERRMRMDPEQYRYDISLRGEFVRQVMASDLSEEDKSTVLRRGLAALKGE